MGELFAHPRIENLEMDLVPLSKAESSFLLEAGDLLFARQSLVLSGAGQCSIFIGNTEPTVFESHLIRCRLDKSVANPNFFFYFFRSPAGRTAIEAIVEQGAGASGIRGSDLVNILVPLPPKAIQEETATVLTALDDRIALLRETNATLEAIAQALFKSWFVDFDPVHAKQQGIAPAGMDEATAALFPDSFEDSELGVLPKGWRTGSVLDIANLLSGGTPKTDRPEFWGGDIAWASAKDVSQSNAPVLTQTDRTITPEGLEKSATQMIPAMATVVVARGATTGRMVLFGKPMAMNQTCYALVSKLNAPVALHCLMRREIDNLVNAAHGSVFDTITTSTFARSRVVLPPRALLERFEELAGHVFKRIVVATETAQTLATLRDTLLPRLISGQLRLPEAEAAVAS
ncbi:restriction endonuclease subunit S [Piscinibacter gummiphilus]|uniref:Restriction endonuclease subunit S n=1 Tax=Piscinibacter gummiphilus TaxID=946333 RepID=A0ABZ0CTE9_9BURK|nr:restriction endonuclease subunit S [Piscinibacter gummiphilus]WOB08251.1 restriction endonuclease subunit S [Piscinibacter gummiphilus]